MQSMARKSGETLRQFLETSEKWTQRTLADEIGVAESAISRWVNGKRAPSVHVARAAAKATGLSLPIECPTCGAEA